VTRRGTPAAGGGNVRPSFARGDLNLLDEHGGSVRLSWTGDESEDDRWRALPAGKYRLRTYRIVREDEGELWHVSATRPTIATLEVEPGAELVLDLDASIRISSRLKNGQAQMNITGEDGAGLSIYRAGARIPIGYRVMSDDGEVLASGDMRYG
jgi:hypothetical protein